MRRVSAALTSLLLLTSATTLAQGLGPIPGEERFIGMMAGQADDSSAGGEVGIGMIDGDVFLSITPKLDLNLGPFGVGLHVPLRIRVGDLDPKCRQNSGTEDCGDLYPLRTEDWDEPAEFLRAIRYVRWGNKRDFIFVRVGEIIGELGHGTIMNRYMNNTDADTFHLGITADINTNYFGIETVIPDIKMFESSYTDARLFGGRLYVKPVAFYDPSSIFNIFQIGFTMVIDENAPLELELHSVCGLLPVGVTCDLGDADNVTQRSAAIVWGFDIEAEILNNAFLEFIPYMDLNFMVDGDAGFHMGFLTKFKLPLGIDFNIPIRLEYRQLGARYSPTYFNNFYGLERFTYGANTIDSPKLRQVRSQTSGGGNGWFGDMAFDFAGYVQVGALYEDYDGSPGGTLAVYVGVPALEWIEMKAYYSRTRIQGFEDIFALDERSILVAQARYEIISYVYLVARFSRRWSGPGRSIDEWNAGVEFAYDF